MGRIESNLNAVSWVGGPGSGENKTIPLFFITSAEKGCRGQAGGAGEEEEGHPQSVGRGWQCHSSAQP